MHGVSVIVCCHNSSSRLPATLSHLKQQETSSDITWEVIVVDNASTDNTSEVAVRFWPSSTPTTLRVVYEPQLGLTHARHRGLSEAKYEIVSFIDDDNWVCRNWVQLVSEVMCQYPNVGACGGYNEAVCEINPPSWFDRYKNSYAIGSQGDAAGDVSSTRGFLWGAGLSIRKSAWQKLVAQGFRPLLNDRQGAIASAGGDYELCLALRLAGWALWYEPRLRLRHFLPASRFEWNYLRRVYRGFGASSVWLDFYKYGLEGNPKTFMERVKRTWQWKTFGASIKLFWYLSKVRLSVYRSVEGNFAALELEVRIGRLLELLRTHRHHEPNFKNRRYGFSQDYSRL
jgi:glycosyltransferase involved in cell wall biosynthesis